MLTGGPEGPKGYVLPIAKGEASIHVPFPTKDNSTPDDGYELDLAITGSSKGGPAGPFDSASTFILDDDSGEGMFESLSGPSGPTGPSSITLNQPPDANEGTPFQLTGTISPTGYYPLNYSVDYNYGGFQFNPQTGAFSVWLLISDDGPIPEDDTPSPVEEIPIEMHVWGYDPQGAVSDETIVTVHNVDPSFIDPYSGEFLIDIYDYPPGGPSFNVSGYFRDDGTPDTHVVTIDWGDDSEPTVFVPQGWQISASHRYEPDGGTYTITVFAEDDDTGVGIYAETISMYLLDLDNDADNDGSITEYDDIIEADPPAAKVLVNDDDDDGNDIADLEQIGPVSGEDDLAEFLIRFQTAYRPEIDNYDGWYVVLTNDSPDAARIYEGSDKSGLIALSQTPFGTAKVWTIGQDTIPSTLYLEGLVEGATVGLDLMLVDPGWYSVDSDTIVFTVVVNNTPPVAIDDFFEVGTAPEFEFTDADLLSNDYDLDGDAIWIVSIESQPANGQLSWSQGEFTYVPNTGFTGTDTFKYKITDGKHFDTANVFLMVTAVVGPWGWLHAKRPLNDKLKWTWVPDEEADDIGVFIRRNGDNDNSANGADWSENTGAGVANENDLIYVNLQLTHLVSWLRANGFPVSLKRSNAAINVWGTKEKTGPILVGNDTYELIPPPDGSSYFIWVEWVSPVAVTSTLELWVGATKVDQLVFHPFSTVVIGFVGENQTAGDMKNGMTQIVDKLYNSAYDAYIFDEDDPQFDLDFESEEVAIDFPFGAGDPADLAIKEVKSAVTERGVTQVSIMGYSHGGGASYVLADRMTTEMPPGATYTIPFTAYIDGVKKRSVFAETRKPPNSDNHYNVWQHRFGALPGIQFIQGASVAGSFVDDDVDAEGGPFFYAFPGKMHTNILERGIAEETEIQSHLIANFKDKVPNH